jgi:small subunit ribosomal protein S20
LANHKSALKRAKQSETKRLRNKAVKTKVKHNVKAVYQAAEGGSPETASTHLKAAKSVIDKAAKKGVIHKKTAARKISRLSKMVNKAG